jgi:TetR/AcrR family transcriptional repressor of nem operon
VGRPREFDIDAATARAVQVFRSRGYEGTSVPDLVEATGVQRGSLYAAYGSKHALYLAALDRYQQDSSAPMTRANEQVLEDGRPVRDALRDLLLGMVEEAADDPERRGCLMVNAITERAACDREVARRGRAALAGMTEAFAALLQVAQDRGELPEDRDTTALAHFLVLTVQGLRVAGVADPDRAHLTAAVDVALTTIR